jgi:NaMN:DMB phosphoribosyltransferase
MNILILVSIGVGVCMDGCNLRTVCRKSSNMRSAMGRTPVRRVMTHATLDQKCKLLVAGEMFIKGTKPAPHQLYSV